MSTKPYAVHFFPTAIRQLEQLPTKIRLQISKRIDALAENPRPPGCKLLRDRDGVHRIRSGDYRVLYRIEDDRLVVLVIRVGNSREVYR